MPSAIPRTSARVLDQGQSIARPVRSLSPAEAAEHFGWLAMFISLNMPASSGWTRTAELETDRAGPPHRPAGDGLWGRRSRPIAKYEADYALKRGNLPSIYLSFKVSIQWKNIYIAHFSGECVNSYSCILRVMKNCYNVIRHI